MPDSVDRPITANKERVERDLGDVFEPSISYTIVDGLSVTGTYKYGKQLSEDKVSGHRGYAYESLEAETNYTEHVFTLGAGYNTISLYKEKKFAVPLSTSISYRNRFAGANNVLRSQYIGADLAVFF